MNRFFDHRPFVRRPMRHAARVQRMVGLAGLALLLALPLHDALAQGRDRPTPAPIAAPAPVAGKVSVQVMVAYAHNEDRKVDSELREVMAALKHFRFSGYSLLEKHPAQLGPGQSTSFAVPGGKRLRLDLLERDDRRARIRVRMLNGNEKVLDTTVSIHRNKTFLIGGPPYEKGNLVIPLTVRY